MYFLDQLNIGVLVISGSYEISFCNRWLNNRIVNPDLYKKGVNIKEIFDINEYPRLLDAINEASKHSRSSLLSEKLNHIPFLLKTGNTYLSYNLCISPLTDACSDDKSVILQFLDVTKVKERENYLKKKQEEIDQQRQVSFSQERLASLGELTSSIAHEINNPLAILKTGNKAIKKILSKETIDKELAYSFIEENDKTIQRITELIGGIRNLSRKPSNDDFEDLSLGVIINDIKPVFKNLFHANNIELKCDMEQEALNIPIPLLRVLCSQVFINLFNNSIFEIKEEEKPWIRITGTVTEDYVIIKFTDSGNGIPFNVQDKIFLPFFTTKESK